MRRDLSNSHHLATISFDGRFWDAYLELADSAGPGHPVRGRIAFSAANAGDAEPVRTTTIFIEDTPQEVLARAREFKTHQLVALLRSAIPPDGEVDAEPEETDAGATGANAGSAGAEGADGDGADVVRPREPDPPGSAPDQDQGEPADAP